MCRLAALSTLLTLALTLATATPAQADTRGSFVVGCDYSHSLPDDPIVHSNQPGASHLHDFFGNLSTNAGSTRATMLANNTSCRDWDDTAGYWSPTGYLSGVQIAPLRQRVYYFGNGKGSVQTVPNDLQMVAGNRSATSPADNPHVSWNCGGDTTLSSHPYNCTPYQGSSTAIDGVVGHVNFPECWDQNATSLGSNDTSDMSYKVNGSCPTGYVQIPQLELRVHFGFWDPCAGATPCGQTDPDTNVELTLSSGPYYTLHADFWNTWKQGGLDELVTDCLNAHVACGAPPAFTPLAPALSATAGASVVHLSWTVPTTNASGISGYAIYRGTSTGSESELATITNVTSYDDTSVADGTTYFYVVRAVNSFGEGNGSSEQQATPAPATAPGAPVLTATAGNAVVHLSWTAPSNGGSAITSYNVYRGITPGGEGMTPLATVGNVTTYDDTAVSNGTTYFYEVSAVNGFGEGTLSNEVSAAPQASTATVPGAPALTANTATSKGVQLSWSVPADGGSPITGYRIYRSTTSGSETLLTTVGAVTSFKDTGTRRGKTYYYEVSAVNAVGEGSLSNEATAKAT